MTDQTHPIVIKQTRLVWLWCL